jgi:hypothetical protein
MKHMKLHEKLCDLGVLCAKQTFIFLLSVVAKILSTEITEEHGKKLILLSPCLLDIPCCVFCGY